MIPAYPCATAIVTGRRWKSEAPLKMCTTSSATSVCASDRCTYARQYTVWGGCAAAYTSPPNPNAGAQLWTSWQCDPHQRWHLQSFPTLAPPSPPEAAVTMQAAAGRGICQAEPARARPCCAAVGTRLMTVIRSASSDAPCCSPSLSAAAAGALAAGAAAQPFKCGARQQGRAALLVVHASKGFGGFGAKKDAVSKLCPCGSGQDYQV